MKDGVSLSSLATFRLHYVNNLYIASLFFISIQFFAPFAHPLSFSIAQSNFDKTKIVCQGDASLVFRVIELNRRPARVGRATYPEPLQLWDSTTESLTDFTTHFSFIVDVGNRQDFSDGFAFFLAPVDYAIPPNSNRGNLGLFNKTTNLAESKNHIVAVEFDSYSNRLWDPPAPHVGINVNKISSSTVNLGWDVRNNSGKQGHVWISYNATTKNLSVFWTYDKSPVFVDNSSLSYLIDLRRVLPERVTIGFSASTGDTMERHAIYSWEFNSTLDSDEVSSKQEKRKGNKTFLIPAVAVSCFIFMLGVVIRWLVVKKRRNKIDEHGNQSDAVSSLNTDLERLAFPKRFAYQELVAATNGFADSRRLGQGGSGQVYKGIIQDLDYPVAVKRIFAQSGQQYERIFTTEVKIISRLIHRNLVQFIGWCHEQGECLLVYAYMPNSSLDTHLFGRRSTLQWGFRYKIALGLASALHYLHEDAEQCVLHRDIKSANVLLDNDFSTKLGDFGIAKIVDPQVRTQASGVVGTLGYIAPEYFKEGMATKESDMFSFGVVALELVCGRRTYEDGDDHKPLFWWVWQLYLAGNLLDAVDERLGMNFDRKEVECLLIVGLWCTPPNSKERPKAGQVMKVLQLESPLPELPHEMHDYPPQHPPQSASSHASITFSFAAEGR